MKRKLNSNNAFKGKTALLWALIAIFSFGIIATTIALNETGLVTLKTTNNIQITTQKSVVAKKVSSQSSLQTMQIDASQIELDLPSYYPEELRHPQHFFSGRKIRIKKVEGIKAKKVSINTAPIQSTPLNLEVKKAEKDYVVVELPTDLETNNYKLSITTDKQVLETIIPVKGLTQKEKEFLKQTQIKAKKVGVQQEGIIEKNLNCGNCYWEMVAAGNPNNSEEGVLIGNGYGNIRLITDDGWKTTKSMSLPEVYLTEGDQKIAYNLEGELYLVSLISVERIVTLGLFRNVTKEPLQSVVEPIPTYLNPVPWLLVDYPKIAIDNNPTSKYFNSIYIGADSAAFPDNENKNAFFVSRDKGKTFSKSFQDQFDKIINIIVGNDGTIYVATSGNPNKIFASNDGGNNFFLIKVPLTGSNLFGISRTFYNKGKVYEYLSLRAWFVFTGPVLGVDISKKYNGRIYFLWSNSRQIEKDADDDFEYEAYGKDFDIFFSYFDPLTNYASQPIRVNDDDSGGDQMFPSIGVSNDGKIYVVFLDHRNNQDLPVVDVYYAVSTDGGNSFSTNKKINSIPIPISIGGRVVGDYLDMVIAHEDKSYILFPCVSKVEAEDPDFEVKVRSISMNPSDVCVSIVPSIEEQQKGGKCGDAFWQSSENMPVSSLCATGTPSIVISTSNTKSIGQNWEWNCNDSSNNTSKCFAPRIINGKCGKYTLQLNELCVSGEPKQINISGSFISWICDGSNGGYFRGCQLENAECGSANGKILINPPTINLCYSGTPSTVYQVLEKWAWTCEGINGGTNATCSALKKIDAKCGSTNNKASRIKPTNNLCETGNPTNIISTSKKWYWNCKGINGGITKGCSAPKK